MTNTEIITGPDGKRYVKRIVPMSLAEYLSSQQATEQQQAAPTPVAAPYYQAAPQPLLYPQQAYPQPYMAPPAETQPTPTMPESNAKRRHKRRLATVAVLATALTAGTAVSAAHGFEFANVGSWFSNNNTNTQSLTGGLSSATKQNGHESFGSTVCTDPAQVGLVAEVSGRMGLAPEVTTSESSSLVMLPKYMTKANEATITSKFVTASGYNEAALEDMPLALTICELTPAITQNAQTGTYTVNCSSLVIRFEDPYQLYGENSFQFTAEKTSADVDITNHATGGYLLLPYDQNKLFLKNGSDATENKSLATLLSAMDTPTQEQGIMDEMETKAVALIKSGINSGDISEGTTKQDLQTIINNIITKRLGTTNVIFDGLYNVQSYVPNAAVTQLSSAEPFVLTHVTLSEGDSLLPKPTASPTPTPTPTSKPSANKAP